MGGSTDFGYSGERSVIFEQAVDVFKKILKHQPEHKIHFLNLYNGVKIECSGKVLSVEDDDSVVYEVSIMQILAIKEEGNAFIVKDGYFAQNLIADIVMVDIANNTVILKNFTYVDNLHANLRRFQRVYPNRYTKVTLSGEGGEIQGNLYDISEGGLGVVSEQCGAFQSGGAVKAKFSLEMPTTKEIADVELEVKLVADLVYRGAVRYCLQIVKSQPIQSKITKFTDERVKETLEELKEQLKLYQ